MRVLEIYYLPLKSGDCSIPKFSIPQILWLVHACFFFHGYMFNWWDWKEEIQSRYHNHSEHHEQTKVWKHKTSRRTFLHFSPSPSCLTPRFLPLDNAQWVRQLEAKAVTRKLGQRLCKALFCLRQICLMITQVNFYVPQSTHQWNGCNNFILSHLVLSI